MVPIPLSVGNRRSGPRHHGDKEKALDWLEKTYEAHETRFIAYIKVDPFLDPLRGHPRFEALVQRVFSLKHEDR
jgi:hypothetical protein